jgi:alkylhydroperoxidase family enzyme
MVVVLLYTADLLEMHRFTRFETSLAHLGFRHFQPLARSDGEEQLRLDLLAAWHEVDGLFNERERAALVWTEILTQVASAPVPDSQYAQLAEHYSEKEIVDLTCLIIAINGWNRIAIAFHLQPI